MKRTMGIIAGNGRLPLLLAAKLHQAGRTVMAIGHIGETRKDLGRFVDRLHWVHIGELGRIINLLHEEGVRNVLFAGGVSKRHFFSRAKPDLRAFGVLQRLADKKDDSLLRGIAAEIESEGIRVQGLIPYLKGEMAPKGCFTQRKPTEREEKDLLFGWPLAKRVGRLDIGQSIIVKNQMVLAVEAIEGTDEAIRRGGRLGRGEGVAIKICKPNQDLRLDLPVIGLTTLRTLKQAGISLMVVEAGKTIMVDKDRVVRKADQDHYAHRNVKRTCGPVRNRLRVAVIGIGYLGKYHAQKLARIPEARIVGLADVVLSRAKQWGDELGVQAFSDHRDLLGCVDAASVVVPTPEHYRVAKDFLQAGSDVLLEKPISATLAEADDLIACARKYGRILQVGHVERFNPAMAAAREKIRIPLFIEAHRLTTFRGRGTEVDVVLDLMIHDLDIIRDLVQASVEYIHAVGVPVLTEKVDIANARMQFSNGCVANLTASRVSLEDRRRMRIFQPDSYLAIDSGSQKIALYRRVLSSETCRPEIASEKVEVEPGDALERELRSFIDAAIHRRLPAVSGEDGREALALALKINEQIQMNLRKIPSIASFYEMRPHAPGASCPGDAEELKTETC